MIVIVTTADATARALGRVASDQIPFASSVALNRTALHARDVVRQELPKRFTIRSQRVPKGIQTRPSHKRQWPRLQAAVGTLDEFMAQHEEGGIKRARRGARTVAVPSKFVQARRTSSGKIPSRFKPRTLISSKRGVVTRADAKGREILATIKRMGDLGRTLFFLRRRVRIKPRWEFRKTVEAATAARYGQEFIAAMQAAIRTQV